MKNAEFDRSANILDALGDWITKTNNNITAIEGYVVSMKVSFSVLTGEIIHIFKNLANFFVHLEQNITIKPLWFKTPFSPFFRTTIRNKIMIWRYSDQIIPLLL